MNPVASAPRSHAHSNPGQLLLRYGLDALTTERVLVINSADTATEVLPQLCAWNFHYGYHQAWQATAHEAHFSATPPDFAATAAIVYLPKEKPLLQMILAALQSQLPAGAPIWFVGEKRSGIKSIGKQLDAHFGAAQKLADGHHCSLYSSVLDQQNERPFALADFASWVDYQQPQSTANLALCTYPGVFAHASVDSGSHFLMAHLPTPKARTKVLDFACGAGVLGACLQQQQPGLAVTYVDVNALALEATAATLARNELPTAPPQSNLVAADGLAATQGVFDLIVSHPPFHTGVATDYKVGQQFLSQARQHLRPQGELWLVANKFLPWPELIEQSFGHCDRIASDNKYAVYRAIARTPTRGGRR